MSFIKAVPFAPDAARVQAFPRSLTRIEPSIADGTPTYGVEARIHDPLWFLLRQWQFGEFVGEDAGAPVTVTMSGSSSSVLGWRPKPGDDLRPWASGELLEALVEGEAEGLDPNGDFTARIDAASVLRVMLHEEPRILDPSGSLSVLAAAFPLEALVDAQGAAEARVEPEAATLVALHGGRLPEPVRLAAAIADQSVTAPGATDDERAGCSAVLAAWLAWFEAEYTDRPTTSWDGPRLEYTFGLDVATADGVASLHAPAYDGGTPTWHSFTGDASPTANPDQPPAVAPLHSFSLANRLSYSGMPAVRFWQFEDSAVNLALLDPQVTDLAHLLMAEFGLIGADEWYVVPLDAPLNSCAVIDRLEYTTTFGERIEVRAASSIRPTEEWQLFTVGTNEDSFEPHRTPNALPGLLLLGRSAGTIDGDPIEEVAFVRDEVANVVFAIERRVAGASGRGRSRLNDGPRPAAPAKPAENADRTYGLIEPAPPWWHGFVPLANAVTPQGSRLMRDKDARPLGRILAGEQPLTWLYDAEVPRSGVVVSRRHSLARRPDGTYAHWIGRRVSNGHGQARSMLAYDSAR